MILAFKVFLYNNAELFIMIKEIGLIAMVAIGLTLVSPGTNVKAKDNPTQVPISSHQQVQATGSNMTGASANTTRTHSSSLSLPAGHQGNLKKDNPTQIPVG